VVSESDLDISLRPGIDDVRQLLRRNRLYRLIRIGSEEPSCRTWHSYKINGQLQPVAASLGFNFIRTIFQVLTNLRPSILPQQWPNGQYAAAASVQIGLVMKRHFFNAFLKNRASEVSGSVRSSTTGGDHHFASSSQHISPHIVDI